jgi:hypothetical protein
MTEVGATSSHARLKVLTILFCAIRLFPACAAAMARLVPPSLPPDIGWIDPRHETIDFSQTRFLQPTAVIEWKEKPEPGQLNSSTC